MPTFKYVVKIWIVVKFSTDRTHFLKISTLPRDPLQGRIATMAAPSGRQLASKGASLAIGAGAMHLVPPRGGRYDTSPLCPLPEGAPRSTRPQAVDPVWLFRASVEIEMQRRENAEGPE